MKIWKFDLVLQDRQTVEIPAGAKLLTVQNQRDFFITLWALCDESAPTQKRVFDIHGTGNPVSNDPGAYIGTVQIDYGRRSRVWHVFEVVNGDD